MQKNLMDRYKHKIGRKRPSSRTWVDLVEQTHHESVVGMLIRRCTSCNAPLLEIKGVDKGGKEITERVGDHMNDCPSRIKYSAQAK